MYIARMSPSKRSTFSSSFILSAEIPDGLEVAVNPTLFERGQFDPAVRQARFLGQTACSFLFSSFQCSRTSSINSLRQHRKTPHAVSPSFLLRVLPRLCAITAIGYTPLFQRLRVLSLRYLRLTGLECTADELLDFLRAHNLLQVALIVVNIWDEDGEGWREILAAIRDKNLIEMLEMIGCLEEGECISYREPRSKGPVDRNVMLISGGVFPGSSLPTVDWTTMINGLVIVPEGEDDGSRR